MKRMIFAIAVITGIILNGINAEAAMGGKHTHKIKNHKGHSGMASGYMDAHFRKPPVW